MNTEAQKMLFEEIDKSFSELKKNVHSTQATTVIVRNLNMIFQQNFSLQILPTKQSDQMVVMSVFPSQATISSIIDSIIKEEKTDVINYLWQKNKDWMIEIDRRVLDDSIVPISARECTALLMHEIGHVVISNEIPTRIGKVMKYEFAKFAGNIKALFKSEIFRKYLSLPILDAANFSSNSKDMLLNEVKADAFAQKMGYGEELESVLSKFIAKSGLNQDKTMAKVTGMSAEIVKNFADRKAYLNRTWYEKMLRITPSQVIKNNLQAQMDGFTTSVVKEYTEETNMQNICECAQKIQDQYYTEFFFSKKKLKKLDPYNLDYIAVETERMSTFDDKLILLAFIRSTLDNCQYYIDVLNSPKASAKYEVPHSMEYLVAYKKRLEDLYLKCQAKKITPKQDGVQLFFPAGYEG